MIAREDRTKGSAEQCQVQERSRERLRGVASWPVQPCINCICRHSELRTSRASLTRRSLGVACGDRANKRTTARIKPLFSPPQLSSLLVCCCLLADSSDRDCDTLSTGIYLPALCTLVCFKYWTDFYENIADRQFLCSSCAYRNDLIPIFKNAFKSNPSDTLFECP